MTAGSASVVERERDRERERERERSLCLLTIEKTKGVAVVGKEEKKDDAGERGGGEGGEGGAGGEGGGGGSSGGGGGGGGEAQDSPLESLSPFYAGANGSGREAIADSQTPRTRTFSVLMEGWGGGGGGGEGCDGGLGMISRGDIKL